MKRTPFRVKLSVEKEFGGNVLFFPNQILLLIHSYIYEFYEKMGVHGDICLLSQYFGG